jgi:hypothetical protein
MKNKILCFKPMRNVHESGYRYIQYGYMTYGENNEEVIEIVGRYDLLQTPYDDPMPCNIDLTKSGWFRLLPRRDQELEWKYGGTIAVEGRR